jgi:hypothetical protein
MDANTTLDFNLQTMSVSNTSLSSSSALIMEVTNAAGTITGSKLTQTNGTLAYAGSLIVTNLNDLLLVSGNSITNFSAPAYSGGFTSVTAPLQAGLTANISQLTNGTGGVITYSSSSSSTTITVTQTANGTISPGTTNVVSGANQTFTITPDSGYAVATLTVDAISVTPATSYTFTNVTTAHTITATYALIPTTITVTQTANGTIAPGTTTPVFGANQTFSITPSNGYSVATVTVDGSSVTPTSSYTFTNVTTTHTLTATYAINTYTLTYTAGANGSISGTTPQTVNYGASGSAVTATANSGYAFASWSDSSTANPRTDTNVTNNISVTANFVAVTPVRLTNSVVGNLLILNWPAGQGWTLQIQTNALNVGLKTNWVTVTPTPTPPVTNTMDKANPTVFYRLKQ